MKILCVAVSLEESLGGVPLAVYNMAENWALAGHSVTVLTLDEKEFERPTTFEWIRLGKGYTSYQLSFRLISWLFRRVHLFDHVIVNGLWQFPTFAVGATLGILRIDYHVFVHGMLDPWFRKEYPLKHIKKLVYWMLAEGWVLRNARSVLFTAEDEERLSRQSFPNSDFRGNVVTLGVDAPIGESVELRATGRVLFLARLDKKKGLDDFIDAALDSSARFPTAKLEFIIAGPGLELEYALRLKQRVDASEFRGRFRWLGMVRGTQKWALFRSADVYMLPSHQENFGLSIVEALACGVPVLITKRVNIWREIVGAGAGFASEDTVDGAKELLATWLSLTSNDRDEMRLCASALYGARYRSDVAAAIVLRNLTSVCEPQSIV